MEKLRDESTIVDFTVPEPVHAGVPESYLVRFRGTGLWKKDGGEKILLREHHQVSIQLGASYPRMMPDLTWRTPVFHPNISSSGIVCLGGYATHWVPSLRLDELCTMLWEMIRYNNFDVESPYNREAAIWVKTQGTNRFPVDHRPIRDRVAGLAPTLDDIRKPPIQVEPRRDPVPDVIYLDEEIVDAEVVEPEDPEIVFID
jgi:hypothetical protein